MKSEKAIKYRKIKERLQEREDRKKTSLYLSKEVLVSFQKACGTASPSKVIEELMLDFVESIEKKT